MTVETSAIVRRYCTFDSRLRRVSSRPAEAVHLRKPILLFPDRLAKRRNRPLQAAEIASVNGARGLSPPAEVRRFPPHSVPQPFDRAEHGPFEEDGTDHGQDELAAATPARKTPRGVDAPPSRTDAATVDASRTHQASENPVLHAMWPDHSPAPVASLRHEAKLPRILHT